MDRADQVVVAGAGGFIGGHLVRRLVEQGHGRVRAIDSKGLGEWYQLSPEEDNRCLDLRGREAAQAQ